jgi:hypothetical protein
MNKIDLTKDKWNDGYWSHNGIATRSVYWLCERTNFKIEITDRRVWIVAADQATEYTMKTIFDHHNEISKNKAGILQKIDGPGWSVITYTSYDNHKLSVDVLIEDNLLAIEFKLTAPWVNNE